MKTVILTGGMGSGKSAVCAFLKARGVPVYDSDSRTKSLYDRDPSLVQRLEAALGTGLRTADGRLFLVMNPATRTTARWLPSPFGCHAFSATTNGMPSGANAESPPVTAQTQFATIAATHKRYFPCLFSMRRMLSFF